MLTALAVTPGLSSNSGRRLLRSEVVAPGIRPPGAITMDAANSTAQLSDGHIPGTAIDGRPHKLDGTLTSANSCSAVASLATENAAVTSQLQQALDSVRQGIVNTANASCNADGTSKSGNICTYGLWWVRGTGSTPRFVTGTSTSNSGSGGSGDNSSPGGSGSHDDKNQLTSTTSTACDPSNASCYTNLDLSAPQLLATANPFTSSVSSAGSPFIGGPGNQSSGSMYQSPLTTTYPNEISALSALVKSSKGQSNYFEVSPAALAPSYGTQGAPAIVNVVNASSLTLQGGQTLTGYGLLVVPNDMEINGGTLNWTGIVLVQAPPGSSGTAQFKVTSGTGFINGALLLQSAGSSTASLISTLPSTSSNPAPFKILYSCQAIDMAFGSLPFKVLGSSEMSF
jgi:hypothetical protein